MQALLAIYGAFWAHVWARRDTEPFKALAKEATNYGKLLRHSQIGLPAVTKTRIPKMVQNELDILKNA
jgi:hypothetical protein